LIFSVLQDFNKTPVKVSGPSPIANSPRSMLISYERYILRWALLVTIIDSANVRNRWQFIRGLFDPKKKLGFTKIIFQVQRVTSVKIAGLGVAMLD
jgi:hypothetical protein